MLSIRATSTTETRLGIDSMNVLLSVLRGSHNPKPRNFLVADLLEAHSFLAQVTFEPVPEPNEEIGSIILGREHLRQECRGARRAARDHLIEKR